MALERSILFWLATSSRLERVARAWPMGERAAWKLASRYVAGTTADDAARTARDLDAAGIGSSLDLFGELATDTATADRVTAAYLDLTARIGELPESVWLSVDLSHLGLDLDPDRCRDQLATITSALPAGRRIQVGAEDSGRTQAVQDCVLAVAGIGLADRLAATVQANLHRSPADLRKLAAAGVSVRLVKGAYVEAPAQAHRYGEATDLAYLALARQAVELGLDVTLATHDGLLREAVLAAVGPRPVEQLLGVRPEVATTLTARGIPVRIYVPYGDDWFRYWMRRLAESRGA
jgi:proline dehydrogenase